MNDSARHYVIIDPTSCTLYSFDKYSWNDIWKFGNTKLDKKSHGIHTLKIDTRLMLRDGNNIPPPAFYIGKDYSFHEVSALVDPANNTWAYGFIYSIYKGKATMDQFDKVMKEKKQKMVQGATERELLKEVCKANIGTFPEKKYGSIDKQIDDPELSSDLISLLYNMKSQFKITEILVNGILGAGRETHEAKKAIDIQSITLSEGVIDYSSNGYNKKKDLHDKIANWLKSRSEVNQVWDHYELWQSWKNTTNDWQDYIKKYGDGIKDPAKAGEKDLKKYLESWAEVEDKKSGKEKTDKESETFKINTMKNETITIIMNKIRHRHHLHLSTKN